jgi:tetratricopeptide (TPR) repeat protein
VNAAAPIPADQVGRTGFDAAVAASRSAEQSGDLDQALANWELVRARYPEEPVGYSGAGSVLRQLQCEKEAELVLRKGREKFPDDEPIAREFGWLAHQQGNWVEAAERWALLRAFFPDSFGGYFGGGTALRSLRRFEQADAVYLEGLSRWPNASNLLAPGAGRPCARDIRTTTRAISSSFGRCATPDCTKRPMRSGWRLCCDFRARPNF